MAAARGRGGPRWPRGPRCAAGRRTRCRILSGREGAPIGSGRSPYGCRTTLTEDQNRREVNGALGLVGMTPRFENIVMGFKS